MAGASLLTLLDDIASLLDDVALMSKLAARKSVAMADDVSVMTKVAAQKTASVLGDDLAVNAEQVNGVRAERELPVVWAVARGSLVNKAILVPAALLISAFIPWAITPLLMLGGTYLVLEGMEKLLHHDKPERAGLAEGDGRAPPTLAELQRLEKTKIRGAIRTDFILSAEIIVIALGTVAQADFAQQVAVLSAIALFMTVGVYGVVAAIVKLDDVGLWLMRKKSRAACAVGRMLVSAAPRLMKGLTVAGTIAMFLVGGGILVHGIPPLSIAIDQVGQAAAAWPLGRLWAFALPHLLNALVGMAVGAVVLKLWSGVQRLRGRP
ncbi:DUF808 domain-containing protein [Melaminivora sp.]|uniref:DUF808 domain-containing protein n=1 Tax=Melaminivora sp. TaxID=1933032 RepID=UPI0028AA2E21|nr:DUF808 domain-containing protein [Melaminivora sp.]